MNILFLIGKYPSYGGTEKITTILANAFLKCGHRVTIASFEQPLLSIDIMGLDKKCSFVKLNRLVLSSYNIKTVRSLIKLEALDIIINQWCLPFYTNVFINICRKGSNVKLISVLHGVPNKSKKIIIADDAVKKNYNSWTFIFYSIKKKLLNEIIRLSEKYVYLHSDRYVLLSNSFITSFMEYTRLNDISNLLVINNPLSIANNYNTIGYKSNQILYVGRLDCENKRVNRILEVWKLLFKDYPEWNLCIVGDGPHRDKLEIIVREQSLERVTFLGFIKDEPIEYYKQSSIFMLTSDLEGFGLVVLEAMSYGVVPVVYGSYSAIYDIIDDGQDGFITPMPFSAEYTADKMRELIDSPELLKEMALRAKEKSEKFSLDSIVQQWNDLFLSVK